MRRGGKLKSVQCCIFFFKNDPRGTPILCLKKIKSFPRTVAKFESWSIHADSNRSKCERNNVKRKPPETLIKCRQCPTWLHVNFLGNQVSHIWCVNLPFPTEAGSSESMCCGLACLRLDMVQPSGAESCKQIFLSFFNKFLGLGNFAPLK